MNKKKLSVVMAGAMLATSVAPVLAAETTTGTEIAYNQRKAFAKQILDEMANKDNKISKFAIFKEAGFVSTSIAAEIAANDEESEFSSKLGVKITDKNGVVKLDTTYNTTNDNKSSVSTRKSALRDALANLEAGDKIEVFERETTNFGGQLLPGSGIMPISSPEAYDATLIATVQNEIVPTITIGAGTSVDAGTVTSAIVKSASTNVKYEGDILKVLTEKTTTSTGSEKVELTYKKTDNKVDGRLAYDEKGNLLDFSDNSSVQVFDHFGELLTWQSCAEAPDKKATLKATYTIGEEAADASKETLKVSDLYDGIALTEKGTEILADLKNAKDAFDASGADNTKEAELVRITALTPASGLDNNGIAKFQVAYYKNSTLSYTDKNAGNLDNAERIITVVSSDAKEIKGLYTLLTSNAFSVGVVAGQNRYETAVNVSKQIGLTKFDKDATENNIVLVSGASLVDGLAAAPLAASLKSYEDNGTTGVGTAKSAPLLLTEADKLPTSTKEYLNSLVANLKTIDKKKVKVHLVGGTTVLNSDLVSELKEMGFTVVRHGGDNREETSVAVAEAMPTATKAFVVGANGEADAMSISAVAADTDINPANGAQTAPIIVAKAGGISTDALNYLTENDIKDVTIVGGEKAVSIEEEKEINESLNGAVAIRIAGANRIETNNEIIKKFYKPNKAEAVIAVKDGIANKNELVDALSAANYAATIKAPIVLASKTVADSQKNALLNVKAATVNKVVQVGLGAERTVLETLANLLGVTNNK